MSTSVGTSMVPWVELFLVVLLVGAAWKIVMWRREARQLKAGAQESPPYPGNGHARQAAISEKVDYYRAELNLKVRRGELDAAQVEPLVQEFILRVSRGA